MILVRRKEDRIEKKVQFANYKIERDAVLGMLAEKGMG
jgi:hypothetical protein